MQPTFGTILVVGAGLSGLSAAYQLARRGHGVKVLEARSRLGGRVVTVRDWEGSFHAEGGGEFIDSHHRHVFRYARHFGLGVRRLNLWDQLPPDPEGVKRFWKSLRELSRSIMSSRSPWPFPPELARLDQVSLSEWMEHLGLDEACRRELELWSWGTECADPATLSILGLIMEQKQRPNRSEQAAFTLVEGMDRLARELAEGIRRSGGEVMLGTVVSGIEWSPDRVVFHTADGLEVGDRAVLTLPAPLLRNLPVSPPLPLEKREALEAMTYGQQVKTLLEFDTRFTSSNGPLVRIVGEEINSIWEPTLDPNRGVITLWLTGPEAKMLEGLNEGERCARGLQQLARLYPSAVEHYRRGRSFHWGQDPYSNGVYSHFQLGFLTQHAPHLPTSVGPLHFAGEHTSPFCGYMEGALESGVRAALEILKLR